VNKGHFGTDGEVEGKGLDFFLKEVLYFPSIIKLREEVAAESFLSQPSGHTAETS